MEYKKKEIRLSHALSFWQHFDGEERALLYNPFCKELIIGAKRLKTFAEGESFTGYPYVFSSRTFLPTLKEQKWQDFGNETIAFENYLVERNGDQFFYYTDYYNENPPKITNRKIESCRHAYTISADDYEDWKELFGNVYREISMRNVNKVVISREVGIKCETTVNIESIIMNLLNKNPNSFIFAYYKKGKTFLGATPEVLVEKEKDSIISYALAGTIARDYRDDMIQKTKLLEDCKNRYEHQVVIDAIANVMKNYCHQVIVDETKILALKNLYHLQTRITSKDDGGLLEWVSRLHPTPALGGNPVHRALELISKYERHERGLYAAPIGVIKQNGDGIFVAGIRSALIQGKEISAYTGCGIIEISECEDEYLETNNKLRTILESL